MQTTASAASGAWTILSMPSRISAQLHVHHHHDDELHVNFLYCIFLKRISHNKMVQGWKSKYFLSFTLSYTAEIWTSSHILISRFNKPNGLHYCNKFYSKIAFFYHHQKLGGAEKPSVATCLNFNFFFQLFIKRRQELFFKLALNLFNDFFEMI